METIARIKERISGTYGENKELKEITEGAPSVRCENGVFVGSRREGVSCFKGIPYAAPPTGNLRWRAAVPPEKSDGIFEALYNGKTSLQTEWPSEVASYYPQSEDCLYLNLWVNGEDTTKDKPVMVFFHGGSYAWGGTADPIYDGHNFVAENTDIILVTVGYRVGLMGFVDLSRIPGGEDYPDAPNLGLLDQIESLRWIKRNIRGFGGNPDNVTIFGESAGGGSVSLIPLIPEAKGLYKRIIAESGSVVLTNSREECSYVTDILLKETGAQSMDDLIKLDESELKRILGVLDQLNNFPMRDKRIIPEDPYAPYLAGETTDIDIMIGTNRNECNYWISEIGGMIPFRFGVPVNYENKLRQIDKEDRHLLDSFFALPRMRRRHSIWRMIEFFNEVLFRLPAIRQAEGHSDNGGRVFMYYWTEPSTRPLRGACHAVELAYVFGNINETIYTGKPADPELSRMVQHMWAAFARCGDPSADGITWPLYNRKTRKTMILSKNHRVMSDVLKNQRECLMPLLRYYLNPSYATMSYNVPFVRKVAAIGVLSVSTVLFLLLSGNRRK